MLAIWSLVPLPFLKPTWTSGNSRFMYCWSLAWRILSITLLVYEMSAMHSLALPFFGIGMKTDLFQSCGHCWVSQNCWHIECSTSIASSSRIWNGSTGIPSPPLAFYSSPYLQCHCGRYSIHCQMSECYFRNIERNYYTCHFPHYLLFSHGKHHWLCVYFSSSLL